MPSDNLIATFSCLRLLDADDNTVLWSQSSPNADFNQRPLFLLLGKEDVHNLQHLKKIEEERQDVENKGVDLFSDGVCKLEVKTLINALDGKAGKLFSGLGGSYCDMCTVSKEDAKVVENIRNGFPINRNIDDAHSIYEMLVEVDDDNTSYIRKSKNDYEIRNTNQES